MASHGLVQEDESLEVDAHGGEGRFGLEAERHVRVWVFGWNGHLTLCSRPCS